MLVIQNFIFLVPTSILQGLTLAILVTGIIIPFKLLALPDLTAEASYPFGAVLCGVLILLDFHPFLSLVLSSIIAGCSSIITVFLHLKYKVNSLLAGIITSSIFYSINLHLMGKPNISLFGYSRIFPNLSEGILIQVICSILLNLFIMIGIYLFLHTEKGLRFRVVGLNPIFASMKSVHINKNIFFGMFLANVLCGLSGALVVQIQGYIDINMGNGIIIHSLAAMMLGEQIIGSDSTKKLVFVPILGSLLYQQTQSLALSLGFSASDLKLITGVIIISIIALQNRKQ
ncbi:ABC transporter permease [Rickettsia endosymbiont of Cardiosporidium cionae]|uniref:ABC transporter permease n=1 Tax=Rickettsia endosymbiont of Cardiosporidium cionae TaxID=2777155 RepID=UPI0018932F77|nr:ABC transporter permease [Rickettsia endosymbiont of Cardiosporidium cionae]KAF8818211.1 ABC transporter permease [Rickettsia endosymbiont of Cardiosporidium cionae]